MLISLLTSRAATWVIPYHRSGSSLKITFYQGTADKFIGLPGTLQFQENRSTILKCCVQKCEDGLVQGQYKPCTKERDCQGMKTASLSLQDSVEPQEINFKCGKENILNLNSFRSDYSICLQDSEQLVITNYSLPSNSKPITPQVIGNPPLNTFIHKSSKGEYQYGGTCKVESTSLSSFFYAVVFAGGFLIARHVHLHNRQGGMEIKEDDSEETQRQVVVESDNELMPDDGEYEWVQEKDQSALK